MVRRLSIHHRALRELAAVAEKRPPLAPGSSGLAHQELLSHLEFEHLLGLVLLVEADLGFLQGVRK
jgi:hypothetical protein